MIYEVCVQRIAISKITKCHKFGLYNLFVITNDIHQKKKVQTNKNFPQKRKENCVECNF